MGQSEGMPIRDRVSKPFHCSCPHELLPPPLILLSCSMLQQGRVKFARLRLLADVLEDLSWWKVALSAEWCGILIKPHPPEWPKPFFVDASMSWGISLSLWSCWLAWPLLNGWEGDRRTIGWAKFVALETTVLTALNTRIKGATLLVQSDNKGVVGAFSAGFSRSSAQNAVLRCILLLLYKKDLWLRVIWIPSADNPADGPSRGVFPPGSRLLPFPPKLPHSLCQFVGPAVPAPPRC
jgi:hypothetical protein